MLSFFRDNIWQFVGVIVSSTLGISSILLTVVIYIKQLRHKVMTFSVIENVPLIDFENVSVSLKKNVKIHYLRTEPPLVVKEIHSMIIKITNSGNAPITKGDFDSGTKLTFGFSYGTKILEAKIIEKPSDLSIQLGYTINEFIIDPFRIKSKQFFKLKVLVDTFNDITTIHSNGNDCFNDVDFCRSYEQSKRPNLILLRLLNIFVSTTYIACAIISIFIIYEFNFFVNINAIQYMITMSITGVVFVGTYIASKFIRKFLESQNKE